MYCGFYPGDAIKVNTDFWYSFYALHYIRNQNTLILSDDEGDSKGYCCCWTREKISYNIGTTYYPLFYGATIPTSKNFHTIYHNPSQNTRRKEKKSRKQYYCTIIPPQRAFHHDDGLGGTHPSSSSADKIGTVWYGRYVRISVVLFGASELVLIDDGRTANVGFGWLTVLCWSLPASYQHYFSRRGFHHAHNTQRQGHKHSIEIMLPVWINQQ